MGVEKHVGHRCTLAESMRDSTMCKPKVVVVTTEMPPSQHWADNAPRKLTPDTHTLLQELRAKPEMPLRDFLALFLWDEDLGIRFERVSDDCEGRVEVEILWRRENEIEIAIGVKRNDA